jgi:signal transduction histidine kinase
MSWTALGRSLQARLLLAVIVCALVPLAAVGMWLSSSAVRSGEQLLRTQLDSASSRAAAVVQQHWQIRKSDVLMLATSGPVRESLLSPSLRTAPDYARRAFATMPGIASVTLKDASNRVHWTLTEPETADARGYPRTPTGPSAPASTLLRAQVMDDGGHPLGDVEALIRLDALLPRVSAIEAAPTQLVAYRDRSSNSWISPSAAPIAAAEQEHFVWNDRRWLAVRQRLDEPPVDVVAAAQLDPFLSPFARTARAGAAVLAFAAIIVVALTIVVTGRLTRSLGDLALAADRVSHGAIDTRVRDTSQDEVGRVGRAFNTMLESLGRMMRELSQREAVAAMGELAATMAHQVRSPATAIRIDVQRAHDKLSADAPERALLARALGQLDRLERAVSASLKVARGGSSGFTRLDIQEPLERAVAGVRREYAQRSVTVDTGGVPPRPLRVLGDAPSLEQLFGNVLANAAQASPDGGRVRLSVEANGGPDLAILIHDDGPGMSDDILSRAGEPLFSTKPEGTGLGLAIARRIATAHGGTLSIESVVGRGTTVAIRLPR